MNNPYLKAVHFAGHNVVIAENQEEYESLPAYVSPAASAPITFCWELTQEQLAHIQTTKRLWQTVLTFGKPLQPQQLCATCPEHVPLPPQVEPFRDFANCLTIEPALASLYTLNEAMALPSDLRIVDKAGKDCAQVAIQVWKPELSVGELMIVKVKGLLTREGAPDEDILTGTLYADNRMYVPLENPEIQYSDEGTHFVGTFEIHLHKSML